MRKRAPFTPQSAYFLCFDRRSAVYVEKSFITSAQEDNDVDDEEDLPNIRERDDQDQGNWPNLT